MNEDQHGNPITTRLDDDTAADRIELTDAGERAVAATTPTPTRDDHGINQTPELLAIFARADEFAATSFVDPLRQQSKAFADDAFDVACAIRRRVPSASYRDLRDAFSHLADAWNAMHQAATMLVDHRS